MLAEALSWAENPPSGFGSLGCKGCTAWHGMAWHCVVGCACHVCHILGPIYPPKRATWPRQTCTCARVGIMMVDDKIGDVGLNFKKEGPVRMAVGATTRMRGCGCSIPPHTQRTLARLASPRLASPRLASPRLASPSQAKPSQGMARHGLGGCVYASSSMSHFGTHLPPKKRYTPLCTYVLATA